MKLRPITVMVALLAVVAVVAVALAWRGSDSAQVDQPAALPLALGAGSYAVGSTTLMPELARLDRVTYVRGTDVPDLAGSQRAWSIASPAPRRDTVAKLARAFGVTGEITDRGGQLVVQGSDGRSLQVTVEGGGSWYLNGPPQAAVTSTVCAQTNGVVPDTTVPPDAGPSVTSGPVTTTTYVGTMPPSPPELRPSPSPAPLPCPVSPPPVDVPNGPAAEAEARRLLSDAGIDLTHARVSSFTSPAGATVQVQPTVDGAAVEGMETAVDFGEHSVVSSAHGWLGRPVPADVYPLIGVDAALARLQRGEGQLGIVPMMGAADTTVTTGTSQVPPATGAPEASTTTTNASMPSTTATMPNETMPAEPMPTVVEPPAGPMPTVVEPPTDPTPPVPPQPRDVTVTITRATVVLAAVPGTDGSLWLVPAYRLESADSGSWTVLAIDPSYIAPPTPAGSDPSTGSGSSGSGSSGSGGASTPGSSVGNPGQRSNSGETGANRPAGPGPICTPCPLTDPAADACCASASTTSSVGG